MSDVADEEVTPATVWAVVMRRYERGGEWGTPDELLGIYSTDATARDAIERYVRDRSMYSHEDDRTWRYFPFDDSPGHEIALVEWQVDWPTDIEP